MLMQQLKKKIGCIKIMNNLHVTIQVEKTTYIYKTTSINSKRGFECSV